MSVYAATVPFRLPLLVTWPVAVVENGVPRREVRRVWIEPHVGVFGLDTDDAAVVAGRTTAPRSKWDFQESLWSRHQRPKVATARQYHRQFARRRPVIARGRTRPRACKVDRLLDRQLLADWVRSPTAAYWYSSPQTWNWLTDRFGASCLTGVGRKYALTTGRFRDAKHQ